MTENRKISELTEVTSLGDDAEFVLVTYGGSQGPEPTPPIATIIHAPSNPIFPSTPIASITIGGEGVTHYKFKFHGETAWSEEKSAAAGPIWFPQPPSDFGWPVGENTLTVIGRNAQGIWQPESEPTIAVWVVMPMPWKVHSMMVSKLGYAIGDIDPNTSWGSAFDGDISDPTGGAWKCTPMGWIGQDFGSTKYAIGKYRILARNNGNGGQNRWPDPKNWVFEASNDNFATTVVLDEQSNQTFTQGNWNEYEIPNQLTSPPDEYQYYRLNVTENNGHQAFLIIQEIEMIAYSAEPFAEPFGCTIEVAGLQDTFSVFNGTYVYYPFQEHYDRPIWIKGGSYDENGQLAMPSPTGWIQWVESSANDDAWWTIWEGLTSSSKSYEESVGSPKGSNLGASHGPFTPSHGPVPPFLDDGFDQGVTLTPSNCDEFVELTPEWTESDICNVIDVAGLTSSLARFNGVYDYYPHSTLTGRPFWVKNGIYNSDGTLDWDGTQTASLQAGSSSTIGFIYWIESTTGDSWWAIWSAHIGSAEFSPSSGSHCDVCTATSSNHSMKLPYDDDGPGGFGSSVTLTGDCS